MGCCQDKDSPAISEKPARDCRQAVGARHGESGRGTPEGVAQKGKAKISSPTEPAGNEDIPVQRNRKSDENFWINVLWRRISLFSRRGSTRSAKRLSEPMQRQESRVQESKPENQAGPEKG
ncbi:testis-expressed protein 54 [Ctenodactylus gundi]